MAANKSDDTPDEAKEAMKAKMREALDRKQHQERTSRDAAGDSGTQKLHGVDHPVGPRQFRRKSGG